MATRSTEPVELPAFARMAQLAAFAPGLFRSQVKDGQTAYLRLEYQAGAFTYRLVGPELGTTELRVLQALVALATRQQVRVSHRPVTAVSDSPLDKVAWLLGQSAQVATSYNEVARAAGYVANSGAMTRRVREALERMYCVQVFVSVTGNPKSFEAGRLFTELSGRDDGLVVGVCSLLAAALLGVPGNYLRLDMHEVRQLRTDAARLLHQRLHWIDAGEGREIGVDTLVGYVWPEPACSSTARKRRERVREALAELEALLGWRVANPRPGIVFVHRPEPVGTVTGHQSERSRPPVKTVTRPCRNGRARVLA
jgi:hypothetical protein